MESMLVMIENPGAQPGVLNTVECSLGREAAEAAARKFVQGWQVQFPGARIYVHGPVRTDHCQSVVNDGKFKKVA